jgi:hypothetical protein
VLLLFFDSSTMLVRRAPAPPDMLLLSTLAIQFTGSGDLVSVKTSGPTGAVLQPKHLL